MSEILNVTKKDIFQHIKSASAIAPRVSTLNVLTHIYMSRNAGILSFIANNSTMQIKSSIQSDGVDFDLCLPAAKLMQVLTPLGNNDTIKFTQKDASVIIKAGRSRFVLQTLPGELFPLIDSIGGNAIELPQSGLLNAITSVKHAVAVNDIRFYLNGMYLEIRDGGLTAVCTDGHRLGIYNISMDGIDLPPVIIPMVTVIELSKILGGNGNVSVSVSGTFIAFSIDGAEIVSKVIDGKFPDFRRIIPTQNDQVATASKESLLDAITKASALADVKTNGMLLNFKSGILSLSCKTSDGNESSNEIDVDYGGADIDLGVNVQYIKDAIAAIPSDTVSIKLRDGTASLLIEGDGNLRCIVMPMRT